MDGRKVVVTCRWTALAAAAVLTATGEFELARLAGWPAVLAWLLPVAIDVYAYAAFATHRRGDTVAALGLMIAANTAYHLVAAGVVGLSWQLVVVVSAIGPVICWRVHRLGHAVKQSEPTLEPEVATEMPVPVLERPARTWVTPAGRSLLPITVASADTVREVRQPRPAQKRRSVEESRVLASQILAERPGILRTELARELGVGLRQLRNIVPPEKSRGVPPTRAGGSGVLVVAGAAEGA